MNNIQVSLDDTIRKIIDNVDLKDKIENIINLALSEEKLNFKNVSVSINAVSDYEIKSINKQYRNIDSITDVLSFPIFSKEELRSMSDIEESKKIEQVEIGDIILCVDVIKEHAEEYGTGIYRETLYMITHSVFHLLGYDHMTDEEKKIMRKKEESVLQKIGEV